ncbi:MAG: tyrosine-type recombinase/integrase [Porphyromonadaceae bacterium]|nr:tyrosine-type recombinase/integrase [Porphyromonadaceae bacterium]
MLEEYSRYLQYEKNFSTHTVSSYKRDIGQFAKYYFAITNNQELKNAETDDIKLWIAKLIDENEIAPRSIRRKLAALNSFYMYLLEKGIINKNPVDIPAPKITVNLPVFFTEKEIDRLRDTKKHLAKNRFEEKRDDLIIELLYQTGIRRKELINLKVTDIDFSRKTIKVLGKRNKERLIPFGESLEKQLKSYIKTKIETIKSDNNFLFVLRTGKQIYDRAVYNIVTKKLSAISTNAKHSPHTLRHTFATTLLNNGADLNAVKELLGHSSLASTQVYTHTTFKELQEIYNQTHPRAN